MAGSPGGSYYNYGVAKNPYGGYGGSLDYERRIKPPTRKTAPPSSVPQLPYQPNAPKTQSLIDPLAAAGKGLLDPASDYAKRLRDESQKAIAADTAGRKQSATLAASRAGYGTGQSAQLLEAFSGIDEAGLEAQGQAEAGLRLRSPALGASMLSPAISAQLGLQGQNLQGYLAQQQLAAQQERDRLSQSRFEDELNLRELLAFLG